MRLRLRLSNGVFLLDFAWDTLTQTQTRTRSGTSEVRSGDARQMRSRNLAFQARNANMIWFASWFAASIRVFMFECTA